MNLIFNLPFTRFSLRITSTRSKKAKARRSRETDKISDMENKDVMLGNGEYNAIERELDQMTGFSNMLDRKDNGENA